MATLAVMDYMQVDNAVFLANTHVIEILLYGDSMGSLYIVLTKTTKMTSFKETRDFILLSYEIGLINDNDVLPLYLPNISKNLDLPFRTR